MKMFVGILLAPVCLATTQALWDVLSSAGSADRFWIPLLAGVASWVVAFLLLPKPMWIYVLGHEATHAVWTWMFGGQVKRFKATSKGGHVVTTKNNFLITLAPYFFPFYAALVVVFFVIGNLLFHWRGYLPWFHWLLGVAYAFHVTLTVEILKTRQTDITSQGYLFSATVIFLGNALVLLAAVPMLTGRELYPAFRCWMDYNHQMMHRVAHML